MIGGSTRCPLLVRGRSFVERNGRCRPVWLVGCGGNFYRRLIWLTGGWRTLCRGRTWLRGCGRKFRRPRTRQRWWGCRPRLAAPTGCELTEPAEKTLRNSRSRRFAHCRWLRLWRLRLECRSYQEQQEQRQSSDLQLARFGKNHAMTPKMQRTGA
jgi:hypothetical protein